MLEIVYSIAAENDLAQTFERIAADSPSNAKSYIERLRQSIRLLSSSPRIGVECRKKGVQRDCRLLITGRHLVFYRIDEENKEVFITRVFHEKYDYTRVF
jgi:plasmid stabilization system protein ParE